MHPNEELLRRAYAAFSAGDLDALRATFAPTIVWHTPGHNPLAGTYRGPDEVLDHHRRLAELTDGTYRVELHDVVANDRHAVALHRATARRGGRTLTDGAVNLCHVEDGRISEVWHMVGDQYLVDQFWSFDASTPDHPG